MNYYNSDTLLEQQQEIQKLKDERDAYLAELQKANAVIIDLQRNPPNMLESCLRQVRADAGRDGVPHNTRPKDRGLAAMIAMKFGGQDQKAVAAELGCSPIYVRQAWREMRNEGNN
jgi:hypothetical protein